MSRPLAIVAVIVAGLAASAEKARAEDLVPGGWSMDVTHQSLGPITTAPAGWGVAYSPFGVYSPQRSAQVGFSGYPDPPRTMNNFGFLGAATRRPSAVRARRPR